MAANLGLVLDGGILSIGVWVANCCRWCILSVMTCLNLLNKRLKTNGKKKRKHIWFSLISFDHFCCYYVWEVDTHIWVEALEDSNIWSEMVFWKSGAAIDSECSSKLLIIFDVAVKAPLNLDGELVKGSRLADTFHWCWKLMNLSIQPHISGPAAGHLM